MTMLSRFALPMAAALAALALGAGPVRADEIKVATEGTYKPFSYYTASGELTGFDVESTLAICKAAGLECKMVIMELDAMVPALNDKKIDVMAAGQTITEKHKKQTLFTDWVRSAGKQFVSCTPDKFPDTSPEALKGHIIGTQAGTSNADFFQAKYPGSDIRLYKSMDEAFQDLGSGRIELALAQTGVAYSFMQSPAGKGCQFVGARLEDPKYFGTGVGLALRLGDTELAEKLNAGLKKIIEDGTYKALNDKYFPFSLR
jgi:polar amino acid transport system substrate-binding protein